MFDGRSPDFSVYNRLPIHKTEQWHEVDCKSAQLLRSELQLRGQLRIYTGFPFNLLL